MNTSEAPTGLLGFALWGMRVQIDKRGAMFGGYYDPSISVMRQAAVIDKARDRIGEAEEAIDKATKVRGPRLPSMPWTITQLQRIESYADTSD